MTTLPDIQQCPSPSHGVRRDGARPDMIVLHYTAMQTAEAALERLCDAKVEVSAHYLIAEDGRIWQMVDETMRAWHAGTGQWGDVTDVNSRSIGIELANCGDHPFPEPQMQALEDLMPRIMVRWAVSPSSVIAHSDMAPGRKIDPGPRFDWHRLARQGLAHWPQPMSPQPVEPEAFRQNLQKFGYPDVEDSILLDAMRLRFRPWGRGPLAPEDMAISAGLAAS